MSTEAPLPQPRENTMETKILIAEGKTGNLLKCGKEWVERVIV